MTAQPAPTFRIRPAPRWAPPVVPADEAWRSSPPPYVQDALALDLSPRHVSFDRQPTRRAQLPEPQPFVTRLCQALVEVMAGVRAAPQVQRWTDAAVYAVVARRAALAARRAPGGRRSPVVRSVRVGEPADGVIEACAVIVYPDRVRAVAMRLVGLDGRWIVTQLELG